MDELGKKLKTLFAGVVAVGVMGYAGEKIQNAPKTNVEQANEDPSGVSKSEGLDGTTYTNRDGQTVSTDEQSKKIEQKAWLLGVMRSKEYRARAFAEGLTEQDVQDRIDRVENTPIFKLKVEEVAPSNTGGTMIGATYTNPDGKTVSRVDIGKDESRVGSTTIVHEEEHTATAADAGMTDHAKALYEGSFVENPNLKRKEVTQQQINEENYLRDYTERDARKKQLEYEMEKMGLKKYGDTFTAATYQKMMDQYRAGQFSFGAREFIEKTSPDKFVQIMNEIANNSDKSVMGPDEYMMFANNLASSSGSNAPENLPVQDNG